MAAAASKVVVDARTALAPIFDGAVLMIGGFGLCGVPENLLEALRASGVKNLTIIANNCGTDDYGIGPLILSGQVRKIITSYGGECKPFAHAVLAKTLEVEWTPQGTLAERIRAAGAGIAGFYTPVGCGTVVAEGKETREFDGREYLLERPLFADFALIKAHRGDTLGNLSYRKTARNFNPVMATAAKTVIAEVETLVEPGQIDGDCVHTPGVYVDKILQGRVYKKPLEKLTVRRA